MKLIVGLGNPEDQHVGTRHNLGFHFLDELTKKFNLVEWSKEEKFKSEIIKSQDLILVKPQTYMNNSGMAVRQLADYFKIEPKDIIIIYDELDLPLGKIKVRMGGAAAGHHGVESVISVLGTDQFIRIRLGIGENAHNPEKFVLETFTPSEKPKVKHMIKQALRALEEILENGLEKAQSQFN